MKTLNVGLILDSQRTDTYVHELAVWGQSQADIHISHLILQPRYGNSLFGKLKDLMLRRRLHLLPAKIAFRLILAIEKALLRRTGVHRDHYKSCDLTGIIDQIVEITPIVSKSGHVNRFSDEDVEKIRALNLDLLIRCGSGILRGGILNASRLGIVSFHHGDNRVCRGGPAGFWECYHRSPQTGFIIQRLTEELDAGEVLARGLFGTRYYYSLNQAHVYKKSLTHLKNLLKKVASTGCLPPPDHAPAPYSSILFRAPTLVQCVVYGCKLLTRISLKAAASVLQFRERWGISVLSSRWNEAVVWRSTAAPLPAGRF